MYKRQGGYYLRDAAQRASLEPPSVDGKVITGWNALAIAALARAGTALGETTWVIAAAEAATFVLRVNRIDERLVRASLDGRASAAIATPADFGALAESLFALAVATGDVSWAVTARSLLDEVLADLAVDAATSHTIDPLLAAQGIAVSPDASDGDLPSGPAAVAAAALAAWRLGAGERYREASAHLVRQRADAALQQPFAHGALLRVAAGLIDPPRQVVVVTNDRHGALARAARAVDADVITVVSPQQARKFAAAGFELFESKDAAPERAYDCRAFVCQLPTADPAVLIAER